MITAKLLCEFTTNPFGNQQKARELLSEIEGRDLSDAELERAEFSFQIAFYFLALLAIEANIADPAAQRTFLFQVHDRIRAFYARTLARVGLDQLVVSPIERDQIEAALSEERDRFLSADVAPRMTATRLTLFDLAGVSRIDSYHDAICGVDGRTRFAILAERVLSHCGGRAYHPLVVATVADLLSASYNIAAEIVIAGLAAIDSRQFESESTAHPLLLTAGMPDLTNKRPIRSFLAGKHLLLLYEDVPPIGRKSGISFKFVLALCDRKVRRPACFVTLEDSSSIANVLCVFERGGSHSNYGSLQGPNLSREFLGKGMVLLGDRFELGEVQDRSVDMLPSRRRWWTVFVPAAQPASAQPATMPQLQEQAA